MIVNSIKLHNFMSYEEAVIDLTKIRLACLTGNNGAGKSALLDAISWAIWEEARASSCDLIRLGENHMWVEVELIACEHLYRIKRSRNRGNGKSSLKGQLEFQKQDSSCYSGFISITGRSIRETQRLINDLIGMDYSAYANSVYLRQGKADEFTSKAAGQRKQVLSDILGLTIFDKLQEEARAKARLIKAQMDFLTPIFSEQNALDNEIEIQSQAFEVLTKDVLAEQEKLFRLEDNYKDLSEKLANLPLLKEKVRSAQSGLELESASLSKLQDDLESLNKEFTENQELLSGKEDICTKHDMYGRLKLEVEGLDLVAKQVFDLELALKDCQSSIQIEEERFSMTFMKVQGEKEAMELKHRELETILSNSERIREEYVAFRDLLDEEHVLSGKQEDYYQLIARKHRLEADIAGQAAELEGELRQLDDQIQEITYFLATRSKLEEEKVQLTFKLAEIEAGKLRVSEIEELGNKLNLDIAAIVEEGKRMTREIEDIDEKIRQLTCRENSQLCPLCSSTIEDLKSVIEHYQNLRHELSDELDKLECKLIFVEQKRNSLRLSYQSAKQDLLSAKQLEQDFGQIAERLYSLDRAQAKLTKLEEARSQINKKLATDNFALIERESQEAIDRQLKSLSYDPAYHSQVQSELRKSRSIESRYHQLKQVKKELAKLTEMLGEKNAEFIALEISLDSKSYCRHLTEQEEQIKIELESLSGGFDRHAHEIAKEQLKDLLDIPWRLKEMEKLEESQQLLERRLAEIRAEVKEKEVHIHDYELLLADLGQQISQLTNEENELGVLKAYCKTSKESLSALEMEQAGLKAKLEEQSRYREKLEEKIAQSRQLAIELDDYKTLVELFGKKGIQAVIIENAVPQIEASANRILGKLSNYQMHLGLLTQERNNSGKLEETLEIIIADTFGSRPYELYSGGEAFKIDFALRIALSQLLACRQGRRLETLIVDEGFGSQDVDSRHRLVKAIQSVEDDFARILVVTHMQEIKEMFETQIQVEKLEGRSIVSCQY